MIEWDNLRFFLTAVRAGNYTAAAKRLRVDRTTVGRHLERLEHQAGTPLFEQGEDGYHPTPAGRRVLTIADKMEALVTELESALVKNADAEQVELRVAIAVELGSEFLQDLADFSRLHRHIRLRISTFHEPEDDVVTRKCEVALCLVDPLPRHLRGIRIATLRQAGYASTAYLDHKGRGLAPQEYDWVRCTSSSRVRAMKQWDDILPYHPRIGLCRQLVSFAAFGRTGVGGGLPVDFRGRCRACAKPRDPFTRGAWNRFASRGSR